jgi:hypothetical protein
MKDCQACFKWLDLSLKFPDGGVHVCLNCGHYWQFTRDIALWNNGKLKDGTEKIFICHHCLENPERYNPVSWQRIKNPTFALKGAL